MIICNDNQDALTWRLMRIFNYDLIGLVQCSFSCERYYSWMHDELIAQSRHSFASQYANGSEEARLVSSSEHRNEIKLVAYD